MLGHPLRYAVFMKLGERPYSCRELADVLEEDIKRVYEAVETLGKEELVEIVTRETGPDGGRISLYRATDRYVFNAEEWSSLPQIERETASVTISRILIKQIIDSLNAGTFDSHVNRVLIRYPMWTDSQGVEEVDAIMVETEERLAKVERTSLARRSVSGEPPIQLITALLSFPAAPE
jgi:hypothetical protein